MKTEKSAEMKTSDTENTRITYARKRLLDLVQKRELRSWCLERNLPHATLYKLAVGKSVPSFANVSAFLPYFAPGEWVFFTDEKIPYPTHTLPKWNPDDTSAYLFRHKRDWKDVAKKYDIPESNSRNIFVNRRANVTLLILRKMAADVNPEEFFTPPAESDTAVFFPERGDIVTFAGKSWLTLSPFSKNKEHNFFVGVEYSEKEGAKIETLCSHTFSRRSPVKIGTALESEVQSVLKDVMLLF